MNMNAQGWLSLFEAVGSLLVKTNMAHRQRFR